MDGAGSVWPGFLCRAKWLCETCPGFWLQALCGPWGFGVGMCWLPPLGPAVPGCWDNLGEQLQLLLCMSSRHRAPAQFPGAVSPPAFPAFPDRFLPSRRHECPGLPPALSSRSRQDADPSSPAAAPRPPATPHPQSGRGHLAGWGGGLSPRGATCQRNCPWRRLAVAGVGCSGRWECGAGLCLCWGVPGRC